MLYGEILTIVGNTSAIQSSALSEDKATICVHVLLRSVAVLHMDYNLYDGYVYVFCALVLCVCAVRV